MDFVWTVPRSHFLGRALIWPGYFGEHILGLFGLHPSSLSESAGFVILSVKASLVSIPAAIRLLRSWNCWSSNVVENVVLNESMAAKMASLVSYLVYYNCI